jgi:hypothetical protein
MRRNIQKIYIVNSFTVLAVVCFISVSAFAQDSTQALPLSLYATFNSIGITSSYNGDVNGDNSASLEYRSLGSSEWILAHTPSKIINNRYAGSIFFLEPATEYEIRLSYYDPDGITGSPLFGVIRTRAEDFPTGNKKYHVALDGDDNNPGNHGRPFRTIQKAADVVGAGDAVIVHEGTYRETVTIQTSGNQNAYILFSAAEGDEVILDGSFEELAVVDAIDNWQNTAINGLFYADISYWWDAPKYVSKEEERLYLYESLNDLKIGVLSPGGWFYDEGTKRLYVKLLNGTDPDNYAMHVAKYRQAFYLNGADYIILRGFDLRFYGWQGILLMNDAENNIIEGSIIHNTNHGINIGGLNSKDNLIQRNEIYDTSIYNWPWSMVKNHNGGRCGIVLRAGPGNVMRENIIHGLFNGIAPYVWPIDTDDRYNPEMDIYKNSIYEIGDDAFEPDGAGRNMRFWENDLKNIYVAVSVAPVTVGPAYIIRNTFYNFAGASFKFETSVQAPVGPVYAYHNTVVTKEPSYRSALGFPNSAPGVNMISRNNIFRSKSYVITDYGKVVNLDTDLDYDNLDTTHSSYFVKWKNIDYATLSEFQVATSQEPSGFSVESKFVDISQGDFRLMSDSPLINSGVILPGINDNFEGSAPDIGAYEYIP